MIQELNSAIRVELQRGQAHLPADVWAQLNHHGAALIHKSTQFKQHWLLNVEAARQRYHPDIHGFASERQALKQWIKTGRIH